MQKSSSAKDEQQHTCGTLRHQQQQQQQWMWLLILAAKVTRGVAVAAAAALALQGPVGFSSHQGGVLG
jgi:hypothetical protein